MTVAFVFRRPRFRRDFRRPVCGARYRHDTGGDGQPGQRLRRTHLQLDDQSELGIRAGERTRGRHCRSRHGQGRPDQNLACRRRRTGTADPGLVTTGSASSASSGTGYIVRFGSPGTHRLMAICGSGTGNATTESDVYLFDGGQVSGAGLTVAIVGVIVVWLIFAYDPRLARLARIRRRRPPGLTRRNR
jgi:hypothetical protein